MCFVHEKYSPIYLEMDCEGGNVGYWLITVIRKSHQQAGTLLEEWIAAFTDEKLFFLEFNMNKKKLILTLKF